MGVELVYDKIHPCLSIGFNRFGNVPQSLLRCEWQQWRGQHGPSPTASWQLSFECRAECIQILAVRLAPSGRFRGMGTERVLESTHIATDYMHSLSQ